MTQPVRVVPRYSRKFSDVDRAEAERLKDEGMERAAASMEQWYKDAAHDCMDRYMPGFQFTSHVLCEDLKQQGFVTNAKKQAFGNLLRAAARRGIVKKAGFRVEGLKTNHNRPQQVWERL